MGVDKDLNISKWGLLGVILKVVYCNGFILFMIKDLLIIIFIIVIIDEKFYLFK